jgi:hypothetical protein
MLRNTAEFIFLQGAIAEVLFGSRNLKERNHLYRLVYYMSACCWRTFLYIMDDRR